MQVPAQTLLHARPFGHQVLAVIQQQLDLAGWSVQPRGGQVGLAQRGPRDSQRVDRVGLASHPQAAAFRCHQVRRHQDHDLTRGDQIPHEPSADLSAVLDRPDPLVADRAGPRDDGQVPAGASRDGPAAQLLAGRVNRDDGVRGLVRVHTQHDLRQRPSHHARSSRAGRRTLLSQDTSRASIKSRPAGWARRRATQPLNVSPQGDSRTESQPAAGPRSHHVKWWTHLTVT